MKTAFGGIKSLLVYLCAVLVGLQAANLLWPVGFADSPIAALPIATIFQAIGACVFGLAAFYAVFYLLRRDWPFSRSRS